MRERKEEIIIILKLKEIKRNIYDVYALVTVLIINAYKYKK